MAKVQANAENDNKEDSPTYVAVNWVTTVWYINKDIKDGVSVGSANVKYSCLRVLEYWLWGSIYSSSSSNSEKNFCENILQTLFGMNSSPNSCQDVNLNNMRMLYSIFDL